jgi:alkylation response protein AidB-like acyl-CoA dehydrogenase
VPLTVDLVDQGRYRHHAGLGLSEPPEANVSCRRIPTHPYNSADTHGRGGLDGREVPGQWTGRHGATPAGRAAGIHTIFEGTSEIQQLVIARAISGMRIE